MGEGDIWYFARGQEVVGPFSRDLMRQIHEGGQLPLETLVWREGMEGWKTVAEVPELGIGPSRPSPPTPHHPAMPLSSEPPPAARATGAPAATAPAAGSPLKLKLRAQGPVRESTPPSCAPRALASADSRPPASPPEPAAEEVPIAGHGAKAPPSWGRRFLSRIFSAQVLTPLFLIAAAVLAVMAGKSFPNLGGLFWIFLGFGAYGVIALCGLRGLDGLFRWLGMVALVPPLALFWPVIMRETPVAQVSAGEWTFLGFCLLYVATLRLGLRPHLGGVGAVAAVTGVLTLAFLFGLEKGDLGGKMPGWEEKVQGAEVRLPGFMARLLNMPELGTRVGSFRLHLEQETEEVGIERAALESKGADGWRFTMITLDGQQFTARWKGDLDAARGRDLPLVVLTAGLSSREGLEEVDTLAPQTKLIFKKKPRDLAGATVKFDEIGDTMVRGSVAFALAGSSAPSAVAGSFETKVIRR